MDIGSGMGANGANANIPSIPPRVVSKPILSSVPVVKAVAFVLITAVKLVPPAGIGVENNHVMQPVPATEQKWLGLPVPLDLTDVSSWVPVPAPSSATLLAVPTSMVTPENPVTNMSVIRPGLDGGEGSPVICI